MIAKTSQIWDYQQRPPMLNDLCLWDMTAQADKVKIKTRQRSSQNNTDYHTDNDDKCNNSRVDVVTNISEIMCSTSYH